MVISPSGRIKVPGVLKCNNKALEVVSMYEYLGLYFTSNGQGKLAIEIACRIRKIAIGTVLFIIAKLKDCSRYDMLELYHSITQSCIIGMNLS